MIIVSTDVGLTGFITITEATDSTFYVIDSFKIEIESKDLHIMKAGTSTAIIKNQVSFINNLIKIRNTLEDYEDEEVIGLIEQITSRPVNSAISSMSLTDSSTVFRCIFESLGLDYFIIPPNNWKKYLGLTSDKQLSKNLFEELVFKGFIVVNEDIKTLTKKSKNHNEVESVLIAYYFYLFNK